jgi:putative membrane-bound dehydrogenase-like protein
MRYLLILLCTFSLHAADWGKAKWLWDSSPNATASNAPRHFRRIIELPAAPKRAIIQLTADNQYTLSMNGKELGKDGNWNAAERLALPLVAGTNTINCEVRNQGGAAGFIASIEIDGKAIPSDPHWQVSLDGKTWSSATVLGAASMGPWNLAGKPGAVSSDNPSDRSITKYQSAELEAPMFILPDGFEIELVAAEPLLINPITMAQDESGRIYVSESHTYRFGPKRTPVKPYRNPVVRLDPNPDGSFTRTLVCDGFEDPVMGIAIRHTQLYVTANNYLYRYTLQPDGSATDRETLLVDKNKAWNPFGMFVLEWGPDDLLYLSVGNHHIDIANPAKPDARISGRGKSGIVMRMHPDGHSFERLVHGLRVPYSFEMDPFANLWLLSNGQGNPNRFMRVIPGVDYHCYSRKVPGSWLAGNHPLAPPCEELPRGANTQLLRYYGTNFPADYRGSLFLDNWGAHGFNASNRTVFRYITDENDRIVGRERFLECADPHFRPSHILIQPDGTMLVSDWYGRDDESDLTGRIWRISYTGDAPRAQPDPAVAQAKALWRDPALADSALKSDDWRLRRLAILLSDNPPAEFANDPHPAVAVAASTSVDTLRRVAADPQLRYEAAVKHAPVANSATLSSLLTDPDPDVRLAGLITIDIVLYEELPTAAVASAVLTAHLEHPEARELAGMHKLAAPAAPKVASSLWDKLDQAKDDATRLRLLGIKDKPKQAAATPPNPKAVAAAYRKLGAKAKDRVTAGAGVFTTAGCFACHTLGREPGPLAPSLHGLGTEQSVDYLIDSLLNPSAVIKTGYLMEAITLKDGAVHAGLVTDNGASLTVRLADSAQEIAKSAIATREPVATSLMPPGLAAGLSVDEFRDLLAFLMAL